ncbi:hypothetical protein KKE06_05605 [Candidatus Micrarchaeota archaeon]|nr:hypothetical protein [Candidatus Micrarchaeota archaeon]MBU1930602.1 hypothetical protein [Candidatus Micrarchaeota archaeon]
MEKVEQFCPNCGSTALKMVVTPAKIHGSLFQEKSRKNCGYEGIVIEGNEKTRKEVEKRFEQQKTK